jgi:hypothetical protein
MRAQVAKAMDEVRLDIAAATTELVTEIKDGAKVARAIRAEAMEVRSQWGQVIGNAEEAAEESRVDAAALQVASNGAAKSGLFKP